MRVCDLRLMYILCCAIQDDTATEKKMLVWAIQKVDNAIQRINHCPLDSVICFVNTYPLASNLSSGWRYPIYIQVGSEQLELTVITQDNPRGPKCCQG